MVKIRKRKLKEAEIPTGSMADIAFLLLIFFLVSTVIDVDTGIGLTLPEYIPPEEQEFVKLSKDRLANVLINENGDVLLDGDVTSLPQIGKKLKERIESKIDVPSNQKLIVSVKTDRNTTYNLYIQALDQIKSAYYEVRNQFAQRRFGSRVKDLNEEQMGIVKDKIPIIISIAEPETVS